MVKKNTPPPDDRMQKLRQATDKLWHTIEDLLLEHDAQELKKSTPHLDTLLKLHQKLQASDAVSHAQTIEQQRAAAIDRILKKFERLMQGEEPPCK